MKKFFSEKLIKTGFMMIIGTFLIAVVIQNVFDPAGLVTGGFSGLSILIREWTHGIIPLWVSNLVLNAPLFLLTFFLKGWRYIVRTVAATLLLTFYLAILPVGDALAGSDMLIRMLFGGAIYGLGLGLVFYADATTGGTDTLADLLHMKIKQYPMPQIMQVLDGLVVLLGMFTFGVNEGMYSLATVMVFSKVSDMIIEGAKFGKAVYIISDKADEIAEIILDRMDRGVTGIHAQGMYSRKEKNMLFVAVSKKEIVRLKEVINQIDRNAFVIVTDAREVLGDGFGEISRI